VRGADVREITFEIIADPREVVVNRLRVDVMTHENSEKTQCFRSGVNGPVMEMTKSEIQVGS
jgi:hypothetical protein